MHANHVCCQPEHMTYLNLGDDEPNTYIFYSSYMHTDGALQVGDTFCTKEECVRDLKKWHMLILTYFTVDLTNSWRYVILCR